MPDYWDCKLFVAVFCAWLLIDNWWYVVYLMIFSKNLLRLYGKRSGWAIQFLWKYLTENTLRNVFPLKWLINAHMVCFFFAELTFTTKKLVLSRVSSPRAFHWSLLYFWVPLLAVWRLTVFHVHFQSCGEWRNRAISSVASLGCSILSLPCEKVWNLFSCLDPDHYI